MRSRRIFTKKQAEEDKKARYGFTWITYEMAQELGLLNKSLNIVAYPKEFIHQMVEGNIDLKDL